MSGFATLGTRLGTGKCLFAFGCEAQIEYRKSADRVPVMSLQNFPLESAAALAHWEFCDPRSGEWLPAIVPGCAHLDLQRAGRIPDPFWGDNERALQWIERATWRYRGAFFLDPEWLAAAAVIELVADGLDTLATVALNGVVIARTDNMFLGHRWSVRELLHTGENLLAIEFASAAAYIDAHRRPTDFHEWNDPVGGCAHLRKEQCQFGWDWGPRLVSAGICRGLRLEAWSGARLRHVGVRQFHAPDGSEVVINVTPEWAAASPARALHVVLRARLALAGREVAAAESATTGALTLRVPSPELWWLNGQGAPALYELTVELCDRDGGAVLDTWQRRIGLRTIALDRRRDRFGERFQFIVNGRPIFAKGANWIPAHAFAPLAHGDRARVTDLLDAAADAHCNMLRVWGGGFYESEAFYDLCDERGLLVWQDFMFACALYPGDERPEFVASVAAEAEYQVKRLAHRACLALWCGNNEIEQMPHELVRSAARRRAYRRIFYELLPAAVRRHDGATPYWPASPHNPRGWWRGFNSSRGGDAHFWGVWHARQPVAAYERTRFRFVSEFGMQSYPSPEIARTFCPPERWRMDDPLFANHQKNKAGNAIIAHYLAQLYRVPPDADYPTLAYLSQLNQAHCIQVAVEHFRRSSPRTAGALYWQLNDCWPVASWSSLEFGGRWKALHFAAKRFFAPALVSAHLLGGGRVDVHTVFDGPEPKLNATLSWELRRLADGASLLRDARIVTLSRGESVRQARCDFRAALRAHGAANVFLSLTLGVNDAPVSEGNVFFVAPRFLSLPRAPIEVAIIPADDAIATYQLAFRSPVFQHRVAFDFDPPLSHRASDNFFDLLPNRSHSLTLRLPDETTLALDALRARLQVRSLGK